MRRAELRNLTGWEIIPCRLPKLKTLHLCFIGDEAPTKEFPCYFTYKSKDLQAEQPMLEVHYHFENPMLYQVYALSDAYLVPNVIGELLIMNSLLLANKPLYKYTFSGIGLWIQVLSNLETSARVHVKKCQMSVNLHRLQCARPY